LRRSNSQLVADESSEVLPHRAAGIHQLRQRRSSGTSAVPEFVEVSAPRKWNRWGTSLFLHVAALLFFLRIASLLPKEVVQIVTPHRESVTLIHPSLERPILVKPLPPAPPKVIAQLLAEPKLPTSPLVVTPKIQAPALKPEQFPEPPEIVAKNTPPPELPRPSVPQKKMTEGLFDSGSSAKPTVKAPAREVQTGGFGDPSGVAGKSNADRKLIVASVGSFDLPTGSGNGNGTAGSHGRQGVVVSAGFGDGMAGAGAGDRNPRGSVSTGGFGDAHTAEVANKATRHPPDITPVEILFKPKPVYTAEARQLRIEGEVLLDVMFAASGDIRVLRVVRGLGHGLDEAAENAAQKIRFQPAKRNGQPCDSAALVHILFELAE